MSRSRRLVVVSFKWMIDAHSFPFPQSSSFAATGYRKREGINGIFSIWVELTDWDGDAKDCKTARLFALSQEMEFKLPKNGESFIITSGIQPVAECTVLETGQ